MSQPSSVSPGWSRWGWIPPLAALLLFAPALGFEFLTYDDPLLVTANRLVQHPSWAHAARILSGPLAGDYQPLPHLSYMLEWALAGPNPGVFHATNVLLHALSAALCVPVFGPWLGHRRALAAGLLFAVHPLAVEPVAWVASRKDVLALPLVLGAVWAARGTRGHAGWGVTSLLLGLLALLAKSSAVVLPLLLLLDAGWGPRGTARREALRARAPWILGHVVLAVGASGLKLYALAQVGASPPLSPVGGLAGRVDLLVLSLGTLTGHAVWPVDLHLRYDPSRVSTLGHALSWVLALGAPLACWFLRRRAPVVVFGALWFVLALLPALQLIPFPIWAADRYAYLALPGLAVSVAACGSHPRGRLALALLVGVWAWLASTQLQAWRDTESLWAETARRDPENRLAPVNLARARWARARSSPAAVGDALRADALDLLRRTVAAQPDNPRAPLLLAEIAREGGRLDEAEATLVGVSPRPRLSLAGLYLQQGRDLEARAELEAELAESPFRAQANVWLGGLLAEEGRLDEARACLERALRAEPGRVESWVALALLCAAGGETEAGRFALQRALALGADRLALQADPRLRPLW